MTADYGKCLGARIRDKEGRSGHIMTLFTDTESRRPTFSIVFIGDEFDVQVDAELLLSPESGYKIYQTIENPDGTTTKLY